MTGAGERGDGTCGASPSAATRPRRWAGVVPALYSLLLALIVLGPLLGSGYLLLRDAVSTPRSYPTDAALGLGDAAPRAVPQDGLLAALSVVVDGGFAVKLILLAALTAAGWGAARLVRNLLRVSLAPQLVAATIAIWNPYVAERLLQGHWSLLTGYAALPWVIILGQRIRLGHSFFRERTLRAEVGDGLVTVTETGRPEVYGELAADRPDVTDHPATATGTQDPTGDLATVKPEVTTDHPTTDTDRPDATREFAATDRSEVSVDRATATETGTHEYSDEPATEDLAGSPPISGTRRTAPESPRALFEPIRSPTAVRSWLLLGGVLAAAGLTPTGSLLAGLVAVLAVGRRHLAGAVLVWLFSAAPWLVATALSGSGAEPSDPAGVAAFAARAEPGLATVGSLAGLGGIWNGAAVPGSRTTLFALLSTLVLVVIVGCGVRAVTAAGERSTRYPRRISVALAAVCIVLPALAATGWGLSIGESLIESVPGAGLLRDTQKYVALAMPAYALCAAAGCRALGSVSIRFARNRRAAPPATAVGDAEPIGRVAPNSAGAQPLVATVFIAALILTLPDLAWGVGGALRPVHYPSGWQQVADRVGGPGDVAVLPAGMFRVFPYSGAVPVLDPAPRMLRADVLQTGVLPVRGRIVAGEGVRAQRVENSLLRGAGPAELARQGVGWLLVEHRTPGTMGNSKDTVAQLQPVYSDANLTLYRIPGAGDVAKASATDRGISLAAHALWALMLAAGFASICCRSVRPPTPAGRFLRRRGVPPAVA